MANLIAMGLFYVRASPSRVNPNIDPWGGHEVSNTPASRPTMVTGALHELSSLSHVLS